MSLRQDLFVLASVVFVAVGCATSATAQISMGSPAAGGLVGLALQQRVWKELGLEDDSAELDGIRKLSNVIAQEIPATLQKLHDEKQHRLDSDEIHGVVRQIQAKYDPQLRKLLTPAQYARLQQIHWQVHGNRALLDAELVKALSITPEQAQQIRKLNEEIHRKQLELQDKILNGEATIDALSKEFPVYAARRNKEINQILSKSQQTKLAEVLGQPFDFSGGARDGKGPPPPQKSQPKSSPKRE